MNSDTIYIRPNSKMIELELDKDGKVKMKEEVEQCAFKFEAFKNYDEDNVQASPMEIYAENYPTEWYRDEGRNGLLLHTEDEDTIIDCISSYIDRLINDAFDLHLKGDEHCHYYDVIEVMCEHLKNDKSFGDSVFVTLSQKRNVKILITKIPMPKPSIKKTMELSGGWRWLDRPKDIYFFDKPLTDYYELKADIEEMGE